MLWPRAPDEGTYIDESVTQAIKENMFWFLFDIAVTNSYIVILHYYEHKVDRYQMNTK